MVRLNPRSPLFPFTSLFPSSGGQCATIFSFDVIITANITPTFAALPPTLTLCQGVTPPALPTTSDNLIAETSNVRSINTATPDAPVTYTFTPSGGQCATIFS